MEIPSRDLTVQQQSNKMSCLMIVIDCESEKAIIKFLKSLKEVLTLSFIKNVKTNQYV